MGYGRSHDHQAEHARSPSPPPPPSLNEQLLSAAGNADLAEVQSLLARGADAKFLHDPPGTWGACDKKSALHEALRRSGEPAAKEVILTLVTAGAPVNEMRQQRDWRGCGRSESAFDMLLASPLGKDPAVLEAFLAAGADPNKKRVDERHSMRTDGRSVSFPLHTAVQRADANVVGVLLRAGANPNAARTERYHNERGFNQNSSLTPLHLAIRRKALDLVVLLLAEGADVNAVATRLDQVDSGRTGTTDNPREDGFVPSVACVPVRETALHCALLADQPDIVRALLAAGADKSIPRVHGGAEEATDALAARLDGEQESGAGETKCGGLSHALQTSSGWSPENHGLFSEKLREQVRTVLLVAKAAGWSLPEDALHHIFVALAAPPSLAKQSAAVTQAPAAKQKED